jgi:gliding motility-associated-like protein
MTGIVLSHSKRFVIILLMFLCFSSTSLLSQKNLSGNLNQPKSHVMTIGSDRVTVDNVTGFGVGDTLLVIQMQGVRIYTDPVLYGILNSKIGEPGMYEFMIVAAINGGNEIVFTRDFLRTYDSAGNIQVVRVPYFNSAKVTGELTCDPWDPLTQTGGVLAMIIGRKLTLEADINVSGKGFVGGMDSFGDGICRITDESSYGLVYYNNTSVYAGFKGEGLANYNELGTLLNPGYTKGFGQNFTGGGGGNGRYSGGGGGSNRGAGGDGGLEDANVCFIPLTGGNGGFSADHASLPDRIFMGGGGGASTSATGNSLPGGNGGGIVIIVSDTIVGGGGNILANGSNGGTAVTNAGAGGGGAGGSIALSLISYGQNPLGLYAIGGNGGNNAGINGEGGGGGGGLIWVNASAPPFVTSYLDGGLEGNYPVESTAYPGDNGESRPGFNATLNGFLFNSVRSSKTGDTLDYVCSNMLPPKIMGTKPVGGTTPYTYKWEKSYDQTNWILLPNDPDPTNYVPTVIETATVYFRRTITDSSPSVIIDISKSVKIVVQPAITGNLVGKDTTICYNQDPLIIGPTNSGPSNGDGINYDYKWIQSITDTNWDTATDATGTAVNADYDPPALLSDTYYKRIVTSGECVDTSSSVAIAVLPLITGNTLISADEVICEGSLFNNLSASAPGGGNLSYIYQWQDSIVSSVQFLPAAGVNAGPTYSPDTSTFSIVEDRFLRRVVFSGPYNVCRNRSQPVHLTRYHKIESNLILADQTICSGDVPSPLSGLSPTGGAGPGTYSSIWQDSSKSVSWTARGTTDNSFSPPALTDTTWYRRVINSSVCTNTSLSIRINVHKPISNNVISLLDGVLVDTTLCYNQLPNPLLGSIASGGTNIPGSYGYQWTFSTDNTNYSPVPSAGTGVNYTPSGALTASTYYRRRVTSGSCIGESNTITITILPLITNNIISSGSSSVCYNLPSDPLTGATPAGGSGSYLYFWEQSSNGGTNWTPATGTNNLSNYQQPPLTIPMSFRRTVISGANDCCINISAPLAISIDPLPVSPVNAGPDIEIYSVGRTSVMNADPPLTGIGETGFWSVLEPATSTIDNLSDSKTEVENLSVGDNFFLWTISNGNCELDDSVKITLYEDFIPQGFSPNGDLINDRFIIEGLNLTDQIADLSIVNGAGTEVFSTSNRGGEFAEWDGKNSRGMDLPEGTYYYLLHVTSKATGQTIKKTQGFIVLKRY